MSLIYSPFAGFMIPQNNAVNVDAPFDLQFIFDGYVCHKVLYHFYDGNDIIGSGTSLETIYTQQNYKYNNDLISITVPANHFLGQQITNIGWRCYVFGEYKSMTVNTSNQCNIPNHGYSTGDLVNINTNTTIDEIPYKAYVYVISDSLIILYSTRENALANKGTPLAKAFLDGKKTCAMSYSIVSAFSTVRANKLELNVSLITFPLYTFIPVFTDTTVYIPRVSKWEAFLYSSANELLESSGEIFNGFVQYQFKNALFSNNKYKVQFIAYDTNGYEYDTGIVQFDVKYETPSIGFSPVAVNNCTTSSIDIEWGDATNINGIVTGTYSYLDNFITDNDTALQLDKNSSLTYRVDIPTDSPPIFIFSPYNNTFDGIIMRMDNEITGDYISVGYSQSDAIFKYDVNGIILNIDAPKIEYVKITKEGISVNLSNSKYFGYERFSISGNSYQDGGIIEPNFDIDGYCAINNKKIMIDGIEKELLSAGDITDIYYGGSKIFKKVENIVITGDENWIKDSLTIPNHIVFSTTYFSDKIRVFASGIQSLDIVCTRALAYTSATAPTNKDIIFMTSNNTNEVKVYIAIQNYFGVTQVEQFTNMLNSYYMNDVPCSINIPINNAYGIRYKKTDSNPVCERVGWAVGKVANVGVDQQVVVNDFDNIFPWSEMKICNVIKNKAVCYIGDAAFKLDGSNGDVMVQIPKHYSLHEEITVGTDVWVYEWISRYKLDGYTLSPKFKLDGIGEERPYFYVGCFEGRTGFGLLSSIRPLNDAGEPINNRNLDSMRGYVEEKNIHYNTTHYGMEDIATIDMLNKLFTIEFATRNSQSIMMGSVNFKTYTTPTGTLVRTYDVANKKFAVSNTDASLFRVGCEVDVITGFQARRYNLGICTEKRATLENFTWIYTSQPFAGGEPPTTGDKVYVMGYTQGITMGFIYDKIKASSGSIGSNTDGYSPCNYRGIENIYGNYSKFVDGLLTRNNQSSVCLQPSKYSSALTDYNSLSYTNAPQNGFINAIGYDNNYPFARLPIDSHGSSTTYFCDNYASDGAALIDTSIWGGSFSDGLNAGINYKEMLNVNYQDYSTTCRLTSFSFDE